MSVAFDRRTSQTASQVGIVGINGANLVTFEAKFSTCP